MNQNQMLAALGMGGPPPKRTYEEIRRENDGSVLPSFAEMQRLLDEARTAYDEAQPLVVYSATVALSSHVVMLNQFAMSVAGEIGRPDEPAPSPADTFTSSLELLANATEALVVPSAGAYL